MSTSPARTIAMQFASWFNADDLPELSESDLDQRARDSGTEAAQRLGPKAAEAATLLGR